jgi:PelA/Pel-15E family pectate lyase
MTRVLILLQKAVRKEAPFDTDLLTEDQLERAKKAIDKGVEYILKSQIVMDGVRTVWCAQHGMEDYKPKPARSYELASKSGSESVLVVAFLMSRPQTPEVKEAVKAALAWYRNPDTYLADTAYVRSNENPITLKKGSRMWFRFYELDTNKGFFCNRDGVPVYDIMKVTKERRTGYVWGGDWGERLLAYARSVGY